MNTKLNETTSDSKNRKEPPPLEPMEVDEESKIIKLLKESKKEKKQQAKEENGLIYINVYPTCALLY